jgi:hypothetical protein
LIEKVKRKKTQNMPRALFLPSINSKIKACNRSAPISIVLFAEEKYRMTKYMSMYFKLCFFYWEKMKRRSMFVPEMSIATEHLPLPRRDGIKYDIYIAFGKFQVSCSDSPQKMAGVISRWHSKNCRCDIEVISKK